MGRLAGVKLFCIESMHETIKGRLMTAANRKRDVFNYFGFFFCYYLVLIAAFVLTIAAYKYNQFDFW